MLRLTGDIGGPELKIIKMGILKYNSRRFLNLFEKNYAVLAIFKSF